MQWCKEKTIDDLMEKNKNTQVLFFCDNDVFRKKISKKYSNVIITNSKIEHIGLSNITYQGVLDAVTDFYIICNAKIIYGVTQSGFSREASLFYGNAYERVR